jgi:hypothetical protein
MPSPKTLLPFQGTLRSTYRLNCSINIRPRSGKPNGLPSCLRRGGNIHLLLQREERGNTTPLLLGQTTYC